MLRTVSAVEQRPWLLLGVVFCATVFFGFVVQAAGNIYLRWRDDPIVSEYRTTLTYTSAIIGDGLLIPLVNVFMTSQLAAWRRRSHLAEIAGAVLGAAVITIAVHLYQAVNALLNWTMVKPFEWTALGYYHAMFMWTELSFVLFFWGQVALVGRERPRAILSQRVGYAFLCGALFLRLLFADYGYIR
ncbi:MAG TPA: hypothetical protein VGQ86_11980 [Candidatus Limnocylindria bacterium]|jgi:hypothetical protein|nr:hypothetical protein [Candidatus Limnocylindria bacterium]